MDMYKAFLGTNIHFNKVDNTLFRTFSTTYTDQEISEEQTLRKHYLTDRYEKTMTNILNNVFGKEILGSIDKTTDCEGLYVANVIISILERTNRINFFY